MAPWCSLLCLLLTCGTRPPLPSTPPSSSLTVDEVLGRLPFQVYGWGRDPQNAELAFPYIAGVGSVTPQEVADALQLAGIEVNLQRISILGPPKLPPLLQSDSPVQAALSSAGSGQSGEAYQITVKLRNSTPYFLQGSYGDDAVNAVIEDSAGRPAFWATKGVTSAVGILMTCPPLKFCNNDLRLNFELNRFQPGLSLEPGRYTLKVFVNTITFSSGEYTRNLSFQLPPQTLTILP